MGREHLLLRMFALGMLAALAGWTLRPAIATDLKIVTGSATGTYIKIGQNIADHVAQSGIGLTVMESSGSLTNAYAVRYSPGVQLGIVQSDVLAFLETRARGVVRAGVSQADIPKLIQMVDSLKLVLPLYIEEAHLLVREDVQSVAELADKKVAVGSPGSGTFITAEQVFRALGISVKPMPRMETADAIDLLQEGQIDGVFYVVGQPATVFNKDAQSMEGLKFLKLDHPALLEAYEYVTINRSSYPWMVEDVESIGVRSLLIAYDYQGQENCAAIGDLAEQVVSGLGALRERGHAKWGQVDFSQEVFAWSRYRCVGAAMSPQHPNASTTNGSGGTGAGGTGAGGGAGADILNRFSR